MIQILVASSRRDDFSGFEKALEEKGARVLWTDRQKDLMEKAEKEPPDLAIVDENLSDGPGGLEAVETLTRINPFLNCAAVTGLSEEDFHDASEGFGVLAGLPKNPGKEDALKLIEALEKILTMTGKSIQ
ncbi:Response regulator receiver protein [Candidatus Desulfarcum epimagneticum]|uniref:Response regulator receiver protein n=1 Tax=uncultured Desulfobacteraceae bacterium TaxID=218296 RepID=A0A484HHE2_9BACT|nr:Response regulator receiver protein [uncultured Desulfobacteraceae bacterium]